MTDPYCSLSQWHVRLDMEPQSEEIPAVHSTTSEHASSAPPTNEELDADTNVQVVAPTSQFQSTVQQLTDQTLSFLSTASNETLGACLVGLGATTYVVLGRVGLVLIGVVGGVVLHATWEGSSQGGAQAAEENRRRQVGIDVVSRVLDWRTQRKSNGEEEAEEAAEEAANSRVELLMRGNLDFTGFQPETQDALNGFTEAIISDYVKYGVDFFYFLHHG